MTAVATNAMLEGGMFSKKPNESIYTDGSTVKTKTYTPYHPLNGLVYNIVPSVTSGEAGTMNRAQRNMILRIIGPL